MTERLCVQIKVMDNLCIRKTRQCLHLHITIECFESEPIDCTASRAGSFVAIQILAPRPYEQTLATCGLHLHGVYFSEIVSATRNFSKICQHFRNGSSTAICPYRLFTFGGESAILSQKFTPTW